MCVFYSPVVWIWREMSFTTNKYHWTLLDDFLEWGTIRILFNACLSSLKYTPVWFMCMTSFANLYWFFLCFRSLNLFFASGFVGSSGNMFLFIWLLLMG